MVTIERSVYGECVFSFEKNFEFFWQKLESVGDFQSNNTAFIVSFRFITEPTTVIYIGFYVKGISTCFRYSKYCPELFLHSNILSGHETCLQHTVFCVALPYGPKISLLREVYLGFLLRCVMQSGLFAINSFHVFCLRVSKTRCQRKKRHLANEKNCLNTKDNQKFVCFS